HHRTDPGVRERDEPGAAHPPRQALGPRPHHRPPGPRGGHPPDHRRWRCTSGGPQGVAHSGGTWWAATGVGMMCLYYLAALMIGTARSGVLRAVRLMRYAWWR